ncbi:hypothetical protein ACFLVV_02425 [Chloroflexota bacterium]
MSKGKYQFDQLVASLPSVYPSTVLESLERLAKAGRITPLVLEKALEYVKQERVGPITSSHEIRLPVPHPLDYDWRFCDASAERLLEIVLASTREEDCITFLGAPTVVRKAIELGFPRQLVLLDSNLVTLEPLRKAAANVKTVLCNLLCDPLPSFEAKMIIIDPPWYEEYIDCFLWAAGQLCASKGKVLASLPPVGTRPGMENEWIRILDKAKYLGFTLSKLERGVLPYVSPPFERNALKAAGINTYLGHWRRGDLVEFTLSARNSVVAPPSILSYSLDWDEEVCCGVRIRVNNSSRESDFLNPCLISVIPGDILPSVSRRDKRRYLAKVWTSGNRIFACKGTTTFRYILEALAANRSPEKTLVERFGRSLTENEKHLAVHTSTQIAAIIDLEVKENSEYMEEYGAQLEFVSH